MLRVETGLTTQRRSKLLVNFNLIARDNLVGLVGHADDRLQLLKHRVGHAFFERGSSVRGDAVMAVVGDADGNVDELFRERIERAGRHDLFYALPGAF